MPPMFAQAQGIAAAPSQLFSFLFFFFCLVSKAHSSDSTTVRRNNNIHISQNRTSPVDTVLWSHGLVAVLRPLATRGVLNRTPIPWRYSTKWALVTHWVTKLPWQARSASNEIGWAFQVLICRLNRHHLHSEMFGASTTHPTRGKKDSGRKAFSFIHIHIYACIYICVCVRSSGHCFMVFPLDARLFRVKNNLEVIVSYHFTFK